MNLDDLSEDYIRSLANESLERLDSQLADLEACLEPLLKGHRRTESGVVGLLPPVQERRRRCGLVRNLRRIHGGEGIVVHPKVQAFEETTPQQRFTMSEGKGVHVLSIKRETLGNGEWRREDFETPKAVPPTPLVHEPEAMGQILAYLGSEPKDSFLLFVIRVDRYRGHLFYKAQDDDNFLIYVIFPFGVDAS